jgi:ABC-type dipeptide/oligopeptide/nickel transport system ATPase component
VPMTPQLLTIEGLHVSYSTREGDVPAVVDVSLSLQQGECVALSESQAVARRL